MLGFSPQFKPPKGRRKVLCFMAGPVVIFLQRDAYEAAWMATSLALTAQAAGDAVTVVLSFAALRAWAEDRLGADGSATRRRGDELRAADPTRLLGEASALGAKLVACETVVKLTGLPQDVARAHLDQVLGLQSIWKLAEGARVLSF